MARSISNIAYDIRQSWKTPYFSAKPYLEAMLELDNIQDSFYQDSARSVVLYFLSNAATWRGPEAKALKSELKALLK